VLQAGRAQSALLIKRRRSAGLIAVTKYHHGQKVPGAGELFNQTAPKMLSESLEHSGSAWGPAHAPEGEDDEGRREGEWSSLHPWALGCTGSAGDPSARLGHTHLMAASGLQICESTDFKCFQRISCI